MWRAPDLSRHAFRLRGGGNFRPASPRHPRLNTLISAASSKLCLFKVCSLPKDTRLQCSEQGRCELSHSCGSDSLKPCRSLLAFLHIFRRWETVCVSAALQHPLKMLCIFCSLSRRRAETCQTVRQMRFFFRRTAHAFDSPLYDMHSPFRDLNAEPPPPFPPPLPKKQESGMMAVLQDEAANMSERVFTPSDSFYFPLISLYSAIIHFDSEIIKPVISNSFYFDSIFFFFLLPSELWRASLIKMASEFHLFSKSDLNLCTHSQLYFLSFCIKPFSTRCSFSLTSLDCAG